jgi:hypothetical protein
VKGSFQFLQDIASKGAILILLRLRDMFLSATNLVGLPVCSSLVTIGFSTSQQQFIGRQLLLAHGGGGNGRTLADGRMATMAVMFEDRGTVAFWRKVRSPKGLEGGGLYFIGED